MTIAVGAHVSKHSTSLVTVTTTNAVTSTASGSSFVVFTTTGGATAPTITDSKGNTYTQIGSTIAGGLGYCAAAYIKVNGTGGSSHTFTATTGTNENTSLYAVEVTGALTTASIQDRSPAGILDTASPYTTNLTGATTQANELLLAFAATGTASGTETLTWGNSFTAIDAEGDANFSTGGDAQLVVSAMGSYQGSVTSSGAGTTEAVMFILSLRSAVPGNPVGIFYGGGTTS